MAAEELTAVWRGLNELYCIQECSGCMRLNGLKLCVFINLSADGRNWAGEAWM